MAGESVMVFVFGSNLAGRHGKGAAKFAMEHRGARYGVGVGREGMSYAIPTKDHDLKTLSIPEIESFFSDFSEYARENPDELFLLTPIGTGLAGHSKRDIWSMVKRVGISDNVVLSSTWLD